MKFLIIACTTVASLAVVPASAQSVVVPRVGDIRISRTPLVFREELAVIRRARASLSAARDWNHRDTGTCSTSRRVSLHCALEQAARAERVQPAVLDAALQEARLVIWDVVVSREFDHPLMDYNNAPETGFADIQRVLRWVQTRVNRRLAQGQSAASTGQDSPQADPPAAPVDLLIVREARELLKTATTWNSRDTRDCPAGATSFSLYCALVEASDRLIRDLEPRGAAMQEARFIVDDLSKGRKYEHRLMDFNNDPATGFAGIHQALELIQARLEQRLSAGQ